MFIGESFIGDGPNAAHINIVLGTRDGLGSAWAGTLASPSAGHLPFMVVLQPGVPVKPATVFINKAALCGTNHENMTWGPAQAGVAKGLQEALLEGILPSEAENSWCAIVAVWVNPSADDADQVFANNYAATKNAAIAAVQNLPNLETVRAAAANVHNPFYTPKAR
jgi:5,6,7,8-tetrahydromethanopterin hydro-lyase